MARKKRIIIVKKIKGNYSGLIYISLFILLAATFLAAWPDIKTRFLTYGQVNIPGIQFNPQPPKSNLQLNWFLLSSPTPYPTRPVTVPRLTQPLRPSSTQPPLPSPTTSTSVIVPLPTHGRFCALDDDNGIVVPNTCECIDLAVVCKEGVPFTDKGAPFNINAKEVVYNGPQSHLETLCKGSPIAAGPNGRYCIAKPVVYLYPTAATNVDVRVESEGEVVVSDPLYPDGGWKNVLAFPNGTLYYQGKQYSELFFETEVSDIKKPEKGIIIQTSQLEKRLGEIIDQLGLINHEKRDFLEFWVPRLKALNTPYIFFSVLDTSEKLRLDDVIISPKPDTEIAFIAYFKGIVSPDYDGSLQLPPKPERVGFVSVEWGGSLDN